MEDVDGDGGGLMGKAGTEVQTRSESEQRAAARGGVRSDLFFIFGFIPSSFFMFSPSLTWCSVRAAWTTLQAMRRRRHRNWGGELRGS